MAQTDNMNQQVVFLSDGSKRTRGRDAQRINILIAKAVANAVKSTLGPKGMDKMIVDDLGDVTVSNDGATILGEMSIDHPIGKMLVEVAKTQDNEVGDGTTTVVVLAGGLLGKAEKLLDDDIHSSIIINGYRMAAKKAKEFYQDLADPVSIKDEKVLKNIAVTSMTGKAAEASMELADLVVEAIKTVSEEDNGKTIVERDKIKIEKKGGAGLTDSELIKGVVIDKEVVNEGMPKKMKNAKIALIDSALEIKETETDAKIQITSPDQLQAFLDQEESMLKDMVDKIKASGANVVFCQKGIDDLAQHFLAKENILAARRVKKSDMGLLAKSTGAKIVTRINDLSKTDLGFAENVNSRKVSNEDMIFVEGCKNPKAVTLLVRGGSDHVMDEAERALNDAFGAVISAIKIGKVVAGGGSSEIEVAVRLREYAKSIGGREQLAIDAFAETLEIIPRTLAETAGMDPIDTLVSLRSKHAKPEGKYIGVDVYKSKLTDLKELKVIEPLSVKTQAIISAAEVTEMILRIDDIIAGSSKGSAQMPPGGMPPGMGGMDY
ncbi:TCP-1/cpn60 chaperonin family protein [Candidatus Micrarchaeota archaeon]|nr:TCP-1/cpn60 chaperonin family protein [Candidatus Micrarchaeota archaeon]MBU2477055.1 TCP-1/cpn60 chaperonin family protein [Candidatus Micrarchaeota archaeon]